MAHWKLVAGSGLVAALALASPVSTSAQARGPDLSLMASQRATEAEVVAPAPAVELDASKFELSSGIFVGRPGGYIRVGENGNRGSKLRLNEDLSMTLSESADAAVAFHFTPRDAVRAT